MFKISSKHLDAVLKASTISASPSSEIDTTKSPSQQSRNKSATRGAQSAPIEIPTTCPHNSVPIQAKTLSNKKASAPLTPRQDKALHSLGSTEAIKTCPHRHMQDKEMQGYRDVLLNVTECAIASYLSFLFVKGKWVNMDNIIKQ